MTIAELKKFNGIPPEERIYCRDIPPRKGALCKVYAATYRGGEVLVNGIIRDVFQRVVTVEITEEHPRALARKHAQLFFDTSKVYTIEKEYVKQLNLFE